MKARALEGGEVKGEMIPMSVLDTLSTFSQKPRYLMYNVTMKESWESYNTFIGV